jgi:small GTP-binding protein
MNLQIKLIVLGNQFVGKTSLIKRITNDNFREFYMATIGVDYDKIVIEHKNAEHELILWDTSGQDKFNFLLNSYFPSVNGALILCDVSNYKSFLQAKIWIDEFRIRKDNEHIPILFIANKIDIKNRLVRSEEIKKLESEKNVKTIEISLKTNENVNNIFPLLLDDFFEKLEDNRITLVGDKIKVLKKTKSSFQIVEQKEPEPRCCNIM